MELKPKQPYVISVNEKDALWNKKIIDLDTLLGLLWAVFYDWKNLCLRGGQEQWDLKISQFVSETVLVDDKHIVCYSYTEFGSKNRRGGFGMLNAKQKQPVAVKKGAAK